MKDLLQALPHNAAGFLLSTEDEFLSEYTHPSFKRLEFLTGFKGSYGFAFIGREKRVIFVDGRYTLQAQKEAVGFTVMDIAELISFLKSVNGAVAVDGKTHSVHFIINLQKSGINLSILEESIVDKIWQRNIDVSRETFNFELAGEGKEEKIAKALNYLEAQNADALFIFDPHDVCWLFNIRGNYIENTPLVPFFAIVSRETQKLITLEEVASLQYGKILIPNHISYFVHSALQKNNTVIFEKEDYIQSQKAIKTEFEIECMKNAHNQDAKALQEFEEMLKTINLEEETEFTLGQKLFECRKRQKGFFAESFPPIIGFNENGAVVHYRAEQETAKKISGTGLLLVDSGGQYYKKEEKICGTTDVTRVFALNGAPSAQQKRLYTLVLKGNIALSLAIFKEGTTGAMLDILARQYLWKEGLDYSHGTGHGVGYFLSVHEKPCGISKNYNTPLKAGMVISNEPGIYLQGKFGIRIENLLLVKPASSEGFLEFEILTKANIAKNLLDYEILTDEELSFLEKYQNEMS